MAENQESEGEKQPTPDADGDDDVDADLGDPDPVQTGDEEEDPDAGDQEDEYPAAAEPVPLFKADPPPRKSVVETGPQVSRIQLIEYMNGREWWRTGQFTLLFTTLYWVSFIYIVLLRENADAAFLVHSNMVKRIEAIIAHPGFSGMPYQDAVEEPRPCRCACRSKIHEEPPGPCDDDMRTQSFDFMGTLPEAYATQLLRAGYGAGFEQQSDAGEPVYWNNISDSTDAWTWVTHGLLPELWGTIGGAVVRRPGLVLRRNLIIGGIRARQRRVKIAANCDLPSDLRPLYGARCRSSEPDSAAYGPMGQFTPTSGIDEEGVFDAAFDVERPLSFALDSATYLERNHWIDGATRSLDMEAVLLNAEAAIFIILRISFTFDFNGAVDQRVSAKVLDAVGDVTVMNYLPECIWLLLIFMLLRKEIFEIIFSCYRREIKKYFTDLWNWIDWMSIGVGLTIAIIWFVIVQHVSELSESVVALPRVPFPTDFDFAAYHRAWEAVLDETEWIYGRKNMFMICFFWNTSLVSARFLKGFLTQSKLAMLQISLARTFWEVVHFLVIFALVFANFVMGGRVLFGPDLWEWSTYARAASSCVRLMLGQLEFDAIYENKPISGSLWLWSFLIIMVFLLMNLLLVILIDKVADFRREIGHTPTILTEAYQGLRDLFWRFDWRKEQFRDGEYRAMISDPYADLIDELFEKCKSDKRFVDQIDIVQEETAKQCLGFRLAKRRITDANLDGLLGEDHPAHVVTTSLELRNMGCDAMTAEHLLEEAEKHFEKEEMLEDQTTIQQMREFVRLLKRHKKQLEEYCQALEGAQDEDWKQDEEDLKGCLDQLDVSVRAALEGFDVLRHLGVDSLAPPLPGQMASIKKMMVTTLGDTLGVNGNYLGLENAWPPQQALRDAELQQQALRDAEPQQQALRDAAGADSDLPPMIMDAGDDPSTPQRQRPPALTHGDT